MDTPDKTAPKTIEKKPVRSVPLKKLVKSTEAKEKGKEEIAEKKAATQPAVVPASSELASQLESLHERLDGLDKTIERLRRRTPSVFGRFLADIAKVILLAALLVIAWKAGLITAFMDWAAGLNWEWLD